MKEAEELGSGAEGAPSQFFFVKLQSKGSAKVKETEEGGSEAEGAPNQCFMPPDHYPPAKYSIIIHCWLHQLLIIQNYRLSFVSTEDMQHDFDL